MNCASRFNLIQLIDHPLLSSPLIVSLVVVVVIVVNLNNSHLEVSGVSEIILMRNEGISLEFQEGP